MRNKREKGLNSNSRGSQFPEFILGDPLQIYRYNLGNSIGDPQSPDQLQVRAHACIYAHEHKADPVPHHVHVEQLR